MRTERSARTLARTLFGGFVAAALAAVIGTSSGCVPYRTYEAVSLDNERLNKSLRDLAAKYARVINEVNRDSGSQTELAVLRDQLRTKENEVQLLRSRLDENDDGPVVRFPEDIASRIPGAEVGRGGQLILGNAILFTAGSASLNQAGQDTLGRLASILKSDYPGEVFHIVGHTDNTPLRRTRGLYQYNLKLGFERAYTVFKFLNIEHRIPEEQFRLHTHGFSEPTDPTQKDTAEGRARNRRVEIYRSGFKL